MTKSKPLVSVAPKGTKCNICKIPCENTQFSIGATLPRRFVCEECFQWFVDISKEAMGLE